TDTILRIVRREVSEKNNRNALAMLFPPDFFLGLFPARWRRDVHGTAHRVVELNLPRQRYWFGLWHRALTLGQSAFFSTDLVSRSKGQNRPQSSGKGYALLDLKYPPKSVIPGLASSQAVNRFLHLNSCLRPFSYLCPTLLHLRHLLLFCPNPQVQMSRDS